MSEDQAQSPSPVTQTINLDDALARAQAEFDPIKKTRTAKVETKTGHKYTFKYADLSDVIAATTPALTKYGLSTKNILEEDEKGMKLVVYLTHAPTKETISSFLPIKVGDRPQELGSILSFYRRYILSALIGVASEEDDDANLAEGNSANITDRTGNKVVQTESPKPQPAPALKKVTVQDLVDGSPRAQKALGSDVARMINTPKGDDLDAALGNKPVSRPLLDQLFRLVETKKVSNDKMKLIIEQCVGGPKRARELSDIELQQVIEYVTKFI